MRNFTRPNIGGYYTTKRGVERRIRYAELTCPLPPATINTCSAALFSAALPEERRGNEKRVLSLIVRYTYDEAMLLILTLLYGNRPKKSLVIGEGITGNWQLKAEMLTS
jgi:hypothetical protein